MAQPPSGDVVARSPPLTGVIPSSRKEASGLGRSCQWFESVKAFDGHLGGVLDADPDFVAINIDDGQNNAITDDYAFTLLTRNGNHGRIPVECLLAISQPALAVHEAASLQPIPLSYLLAEWCQPESRR